jgi:hypothetical protein
MVEGKPTPAGSSRAALRYSYPEDLARFVRDRWRDAPRSPGGVDPLPDAATLEGFFAACYQASMLREEERPVVFRAILAEPASTLRGGRLRVCSGSNFPARSTSMRGNSGGSRWLPTRSVP